MNSELEALIFDEQRKLFYTICLVAIKNNIDISKKEDFLELGRKVQALWIKEFYGCPSDPSNDKKETIEKEFKAKASPVVSEDENKEDRFVDQAPKYNQTTPLGVTDFCQAPKYNQTLKLGLDSSKQYLLQKSRNDSLSLDFNRSLEGHINIIESIVLVNDEIDRKSITFPTIHHQVLHDEAEHSSQLLHTKRACEASNSLSEDSGICLGDNSSEFSGVNIKNKSSIPLDSLNYILDFVKTQINRNSKEVVDNWNESLVEYICIITCKCSQMGMIYEETVNNFIVDVLQDIWSDEKTNQHIIWSQQINIVKKFLVTLPICWEVLYYLADILDNASTAIKKGCCSPLKMVKIALFVDLFPVTVRTLKECLKNKKPLTKRSNITKLWQEKFSSVENDNHPEDFIQDINSEIEPKIEHFFRSTVGKEPLIALAVRGVAKELRNLTQQNLPLPPLLD